MSDRVLPHSLEAEKAAVGALLLDPGIVEWIRLAENDFYDLRNRTIWEAALQLADDGVAIDEMTLADRIKKNSKLDAIGGYAYLSECALSTPTTDNVEHYAKIIRDKRVSRDVMLATSEVYRAGEKLAHEGDDLLGFAAQKFAAVDPSMRPQGARIGDVVRQRALDVTKLAERQAAGEQVYAGVPTGFTKLDRLIGGIPIGPLSILAARPGMAKTSLAMTIATNADALGYGVHYFTLEDQPDSFADRMIASHAGIVGQHIRNLSLDAAGWGKAMQATNEIHKAGNWWLEEAAGMDANDIIRAARGRRRDLGTKLVIVDYAQLLRWPADARSENDAITYNVRRLNTFAARDRVAVLLLSQLNRDLERRDDKTPRLSDLRGSGELEQQGKLIIMLHHPASYEDPETVDAADREMFVARLEAWIRKNHQGEAGNLYAALHWRRPEYLITDHAVDVPRGVRMALGAGDGNEVPF